MAAAIDAFDWRTNPLGPRADWPVSLRTVVDMMLGSRFAMCAAWGPERTFLYNDAYAPFLGARHPGALGRPMPEVWPEIWSDLAPMIDDVLGGETIAIEDFHLVMTRNGYPEDTWWSFSYSPLRDDSGRIVGMLDVAVDTSRKFTDARRLEAEAARLADSESRFRALISATSDVIYRMSADWQEMRQLDGRGFLENTDAPSVRWIELYIPEEDRAAIRSAVNAAIKARAPFVLEHRVRQANGSIGWTASRAVPIFDASGEILEWFGTASDITQARTARAALATSREKLELATRAARMGQFDYWPQTGRLEWDDRCLELFGLRPGFPVTYETAFLAGLHPDDRDGADAAVRAALDPAGGGVFDTEYRTIGIEDGLERHIHAQGLAMFDGAVPIRLIGTVQDVTADRRARAALREVEERLRLAGRATNDAIWDWDLRSNHVTWNVALEHAYGHALDTVVPTGEWWIEHIHPEDRDRVGHSIHEVIDGGGSDWSDDYRFARGDGSYADVFDRGYVIRDDAGAPLRMVGAMLDVSARKAIERQLELDRRRLLEEVEETAAERDRAEAALRQAQKMEAVGQLTGGIAHDFNNLLTGVGGSLEMIERRLAEGRADETGRYLAAARQATDRAAALTQRLLAFSRRQTLDPRALDASRLVEEMIELIQRSVGLDVSIEVALQADLWTTRVDPIQLESALLNLCINARDAMAPKGGTIVIATADAIVAPSEAMMLDLSPGDYVVLSVADTGAGMSDEVLGRVFEPFYTTKPLGQGTGLGLSMVYGFARQSGGQVRIVSAPDQGTTVSLYLPRFEGAADLREGPTAPRGRQGHGQRVLIVDDETTVRHLVQEQLSERGYVTLGAGLASEALALLDDDTPIDLLITDVGLPGGMNGRQLADLARVSRPGLKVLFITGYAETAVVDVHGFDENMGVLTKPFSLSQLEARVGELLKG